MSYYTYYPKTFYERVREVMEHYPEPDFERGGKVVMPLPFYTMKDKQVRQQVYLAGLSVESGRCVEVDEPEDYDYLVKRIAATPLADDVLAVFYAMCGRSAGQEEDADAAEVMEQLAKETGVPVEVVRYIVEDMWDHGLFFVVDEGDGEVACCRLNAELFSIEQPTFEEQQVIETVLKTYHDAGKPQVSIKELEHATAIPEERLVDINTYGLVLMYLKHRARYTADTLPAGVPK